jgi:hypothetical protein
MANSVRFQLVPREAASRFESLPAPVRRVLRLCDGTRTVDQISASSQLDDAETAKILDRLSALGLVAPLPAERPPRRRRITPVAVRWLEGAPAAPAAAPTPAQTAAPAPAPRSTPAVVVATEPPLPTLAPEAPVAAPVPIVARTPVVAVAPVAAPAPVAAVLTKPVAAPSAFSDEEESFFSSSFEHLTKDEYAD